MRSLQLVHTVTYDLLLVSSNSFRVCPALVFFQTFAAKEGGTRIFFENTCVKWAIILRHNLSYTQQEKKSCSYYYFLRGTTWLCQKQLFCSACGCKTFWNTCIHLVMFNLTKTSVRVNASFHLGGSEQCLNMRRRRIIR
jgi:hypothetical protein